MPCGRAVLSVSALSLHHCRESSAQRVSALWQAPPRWSATNLCHKLRLTEQLWCGNLRAGGARGAFAIPHWRRGGDCGGAQCHAARLPAPLAAAAASAAIVLRDAAEATAAGCGATGGPSRVHEPPGRSHRPPLRPVASAGGATAGAAAAAEPRPAPLQRPHVPGAAAAGASSDAAAAACGAAGGRDAAASRPDSGISAFELSRRSRRSRCGGAAFLNCHPTAVAAVGALHLQRLRADLTPQPDDMPNGRNRLAAKWQLFLAISTLCCLTCGRFRDCGPALLSLGWASAAHCRHRV